MGQSGKDGGVLEIKGVYMCFCCECNVDPECLDV